MTKAIDSMRPSGLYDDVIRAREEDGQRFFDQFHLQFVEATCPVCAADSPHVFHKYGFSHRRCDSCRTLYVSPRPTEALLGIFYTQFEAPRLWTRLLLAADRARKALQYGPRVEKLLALMEKGPGRIALDLGAGSGAFALCLKETGAFEDVVALDVAPGCVDACREAGLTSRLGTLDVIADESVDLICMNDLIEHVYDARQLLADCRRKLRPGGYLSIATPNGEGFDFKILHAATGNITPPEHLTYFNPGSISALGQVCGFATVSVETPGILDVSIIERARAMGLPLGQRNEFLDFLLDQDEGVKQNFQRFLSDNGLSSHLLYLGRR